MQHRTLVQFSVVALAVSTGVVASVLFARHILGFGLPLSDFTVFWTAARLTAPYDAVKITEAQQWILPANSGLRPFVYPPTALIFLKPFGLLNYYAAAAVWTVLGLTAFVSASLLYGKRAILGLLAPMVGLTLIVGQTSLFLGAALAAAVALLKRNEIAAGILFGVVAAVKPQLAVLVPVALVAGRHWRAGAFCVLSCGLAILLSLALGAHLWLDWFQSLGSFSDQVLTENFRKMNMAPGLWFAPVGIISVWIAFKKSGDPPLRLPTLIAGTCLSVPYMMNYDLVAMAPGAAALLLSRDWKAWPGAFFAFAVTPASALIVALTMPLVVIYRDRPAFAPNHTSRLSSSVDVNTVSRTISP